MGYASLGIPMAMVMFQSMGERMNKAFSVIIKKIKQLIGCNRTEASEFDLILVRVNDLINEWSKWFNELLSIGLKQLNEHK